MGYITAKTAASRWSISEKVIIDLCAKGKIHGARKKDGGWCIPEDTNLAVLNQGKVKADILDALAYALRIK
ncbi:MAG: hypothetical protein ACOYJU_08330 [Anaerovoracaceae bacterium]|jgi:hypothetical protein